MCITLSRFLGLIGSKLGQPKVIFEIVGNTNTTMLKTLQLPTISSVIFYNLPY